jgi:hypothetical protein
MTVVRPIGVVIPCDDQGFLVNPCCLEFLEAPWDRAVRVLLRGYREQYREDLHSVYPRGSVPKGSALEGLSDVDSFAVLWQGVTDLGADWGKSFWQRYAEELKFCDGLEILALNLEDLLKSPKLGWFRFALKSQGLCIHGEDLIADLPAVRAVPEQAGRPGAVASALESFRKEIREPLSPEELCSLATWFFKHLLRCGFLLVMEREGCYTRDLYPCWECFSLHYPGKSEAMFQALEWALQGPPSAGEAEALGVFLGEWLVRESASRFGS